MDYHDPRNLHKRLASARESFASAVVLLSELAGAMPKEILVVLLD